MTSPATPEEMLASKFERQYESYRPEMFGEDDEKNGPSITRAECKVIARVLRLAAKPAEEATKEMIKAGGRAINPDPNSHGMNDAVYEAAAERCWNAMCALSPTGAPKL